MASMNSGIILSGANPNLMGRVAQGMQMRHAKDEMDRQNALADLYQQHGAGLVSGDAGAINALAAIDPMGAARFQQAQVDNRRAGERHQMALEAGRREASAHAAKMSAAERAETAQRIQQGLAAASHAQTPEQWDALAQQYGAPELVGKFGERDAVIGYYTGQLAEIQDPKWERVGNQVVDMNNPQAGAQDIPGLADKSTQPDYVTLNDQLVDRNAQGGPAVVDVRGMDTGAGQKDMTESERRIFMFSKMQESVSPVLDGIEDQGFDPANVQDRFAGGVLGGNWLRTPEGQKYEAGAQAWSEAALRLATGAAATPEEATRIKGTYFARAGDTPETVRFKQGMRKAYEQVLQAALAGDRAAEIPTPESFMEKATPPEKKIGPSEALPAEAPSSFIQHPRVQRALKGGDVSAQEIWDNLDDETRRKIVGGQ